MTSRNACKTCALGMGGQQGGMRNELGRFPEVCKKSLQAMAADMQGAVQGDFFRKYTLRQLGTLSPRELETAGRLVTPLLAGPGMTHYQPVSWDDAFARIAAKMQAVRPEEAFFYFSGRSSNEAAFLLQLFARAYGTNHVNNCSYYCHQASGVGLGGSIGSGTATVEAGDLEHADLFFLIGGNPASNHPRLMTHLMHLRRRGGKVVVVNPVRETGLIRFRIPSDTRSMLFGSDIASEYVQVHIGGDIALLMGIAKAVVALGSVDSPYVEAFTEGWAESKDLLDATGWAEITSASGVDQPTIERLADLYTKSKKTIFGWTMGITHHVHGVENVQWIVNLALMRGMVGKKHAGLLPIRGHSNVQGIGSIGVTPALKHAMAARFAAQGIPLPTHKGLDTLGCVDAAHAGIMRVGWALGGNLYGSNPDAGYAGAALAKLDMMIYLNTSLNTGHAHGLARETLILPVLARDEEPYATTQESMFNYVRLSDGGPARHEGPRPEVDIVADLATRTIGDKGPLRWQQLKDTNEIRRLIADLVPGFEAIKDVGKTKKEFVVEGRLMHEAKFPTATGKARFHAHPIPAKSRELKPRQLKLMTVRSEGQFNTVVYEDYDFYRGQERRDVILISEDDMRRLNLSEGQRVTVSSPAGEMKHQLVRPFAVKPGNAVMYYPEANVLIPREVDPKSLTPTFKNVWIALTPEAATVQAAALPGRFRRLLHRWLRPKLKSC